MVKFQEELKKYDKYSIVAKWKILLLKHGVFFNSKSMFNEFPNIDKYKTKSRVLNVVTKDYEVYDISNDISKIPSEVLLNDGINKSIVKLRYSENSPIEIRIENNNIYLYVDGKKVNVSVELVEKNSILNEELPNGKGKIGDYIDIVGIDRVSILFFEGCYNWIAGKPCKFCDLHPQKQEHIPYKPTLNNIKQYNFDVNEWWNASKEEYLPNLLYSLKRVIESSVEHIHIFFMAGNLPTCTDVWNVVEETIKYIAKEVDLSLYDTYLNVAPHDRLCRLKKMKKLGIKYVQYNLEIVEEHNFNYTCPGKLKYDEFVSKLYEAVDIYGKGYVRSNFVLGLDKMDETLEFARKIAAKGIVFDYSVFQPKKNTPYYYKKAPDFDEVLDFTCELVKIYNEYNFKPIFCSLSSRSSIVNEIYDSKEVESDENNN